MEPKLKFVLCITYCKECTLFRISLRSIRVLFKSVLLRGSFEINFCKKELALSCVLQHRMRFYVLTTSNESQIARYGHRKLYTLNVDQLYDLTMSLSPSMRIFSTLYLLILLGRYLPAGKQWRYASTESFCRMASRKVEVKLYLDRIFS